MNLGDLTIHLTMIEQQARACREAYANSLQAQQAAKRPTLVLAHGGDLNGHGRLAVPSASAQASQVAQQLQAQGQAHLQHLASLCEGLLKELTKAGDGEDHDSNV